MERKISGREKGKRGVEWGGWEEKVVREGDREVGQGGEEMGRGEIWREQRSRESRDVVLRILPG